MDNSSVFYIKSRTFFKQLCDLPYIEKIILYGSRARQDNAPRADIDVAIVCPHATMKEWVHIIDIIDDADTLLKIDCVRLDTLNAANPLKKAIADEGIILYARNK